MAKLIRKLCLLAVCVCVVLAVFAGINIMGDPYNVFHAENIRETGAEPNKNFIKMQHLLKRCQLL